MKTLLMFDDPTIKTGFAYTCRVTARELAARGHELVVAGFNNYDQSERSFEGARVLSNPRASTSPDHNEQLYGDRELFSAWLDELDPDAVFLHNDFHRFAWVTSLPDDVKRRLAWWIPLDGPGVSEDYVEWVSRLPNVAVTSHHARGLLSGAPRVRVVPHAVCSRAFVAAPPERGSEFVVLRIDRHQARKLWPLALEGFALFARGKSDVKMLAKCDPADPVGYDPARGSNVDLREICAELGIEDRVAFESGHFEEEEMEEVWGRGSAFLTTSGSEGFGLSVAEALARGIPVVAPRHSVFPEVVGDCGWLFRADGSLWDPTMNVPYQVGSPESVAEGLEAVYAAWKSGSGAYERASARGRDRASVLFHPSAVYGVWDSTLRGIAKRESPCWKTRREAAAVPYVASRGDDESPLGSVVESRKSATEMASRGYLAVPERPGTFKRYWDSAIDPDVPLVGAVVSTRDRPSLLAETLTTMAAATPSRGELGYGVTVVVSDSSGSEATRAENRAVCDAARGNGLDVLYAANETPSKSVGGTRNAGMARLPKEVPYVLFCDDDVVYLPFRKEGKPWPEAALDCLFRRWPECPAVGPTHFTCNSFKRADPSWPVVEFNAGCWFLCRRDVLDAFARSADGPYDPWYSDPPKTWGCDDIDLGTALQVAGYEVTDLGTDFPLYHPGLGVKPGWEERERAVERTAKRMVERWLDGQPLHTVVVPTYESRELVSGLLESAFDPALDDGTFELVLVDNGSRQATRSWLRREQLKRPAGRLRVVFTRDRVGFGTASNIGLRLARGAYVTFLNNDVVVRDRAWLSRARGRLDGARVAGPDPCVFQTDVRVEDLPGAVGRFAREDPISGAALFDFVGGWFLTTRRSDALELGGFDEAIVGYYFEDVDFCLRAREKWGDGCVVGCGLDEVGADHVNQGSSRHLGEGARASAAKKSFAEAMTRWASKSASVFSAPQAARRLPPGAVSLWPVSEELSRTVPPPPVSEREPSSGRKAKWRKSLSPALERKVEVEVCTRDRREHLGRLLVSLLCQSWKEWDLIVVDDGDVVLDPREDSPLGDLLRTIEAEGRSVRVFEGPRSGPHASHQLALDHAFCERVLRVDDDEVLGPGCLEALVGAAEETGAVAVAPLLLFPGEPAVGEGDPPAIVAGDWMSAAHVQQRRWPGSRERLVPADHLHSCFLYRTENARAVGGYPRGLSPVGFGEETLFSHALGRTGELFVCLDAVAWHFQSRGGGTRFDGSDYFAWAESDKGRFEGLLADATRRGDAAAEALRARSRAENVPRTNGRPKPGSFEPFAVEPARDLVRSCREELSWSRDVSSYADIVGWSDFEDVYATAVRELGRDGAVFVEVGTLLGRSACLMGQLVRQSGADVTVLTYDPHDPTRCRDPRERELLESMFAAYGGREAVVRELVGNLEKLGLAGTVVPRPVPSPEAAEEHADGSVDFVFVDGSHDFEGAFADVAAWWPKVRPGGVLAGHDYVHWSGDGVERAVKEFFGTDDDAFFVRPKSWAVRKREEVET